MNYVLKIQYDGTKYYGFQRQTKLVTIQGELEKTLSRIFNSKIQIIGSGRTDTGVHALEQVVNFKSEVQFTKKKLKNSLNSLISDDIVVVAVARASEEFHSRYSAVEREYLYKLCVSEHRNVFKLNRSWFMYENIDLNCMKKAAEMLIGAHDFSSFSKKSPDITDYVRTLDDINFTENREEQTIELRFKARSFLHSMIRFIVGELVLVGRKKHDLLWVQKMLSSGDRKMIRLKAPAHGLYLLKVKYNEKLKF